MMQALSGFIGHGSEAECIGKPLDAFDLEAVFCEDVYDLFRGCAKRVYADEFAAWLVVEVFIEFVAEDFLEMFVKCRFHGVVLRMRRAIQKRFYCVCRRHSSKKPAYAEGIAGFSI